MSEDGWITRTILFLSSAAIQIKKLQISNYRDCEREKRRGVIGVIGRDWVRKGTNKNRFNITALVARKRSFASYKRHSIVIICSKYNTKWYITKSFLEA